MQMRMEISQSAGELDWEKTIRCAREDFLLLFEFLVSLFKDQQEINNWKNYK
jgi:hypothetical protein